jgi:putative nucleotidyltransferase with HDIG domain
MDAWLRTVLATVIATALFAFPIVAGVITAHAHAGFWTLPLILIPLTLVQYFHGLYRKKVVLTEELATNNMILAKSNIQFAAAMVRALDARDAYTAGHSAAVAVYTRDIVRAMGMDEDTCTKAHLAGLLHDIGKIGVPGRVLNKQSRLDDEEFELMKQHAAMGADILGEVDAYSELSTIVRHHHERLDGFGYPDKLAGEAIPAISRVISVADTYSAMTTDRPYRDGLNPEIAMLELSENKGSQLDPNFVDAFLFILLDADDNYRRGKLSSFETEVAKHEALGGVERNVLRKVAKVVQVETADEWTDDSFMDEAA